MAQDRPLAVAAVLLAAGKSRRFGEGNKLLADIDGEPMLRQIARQIARTRAAPFLVVTGHDAGRVEAALMGIPAKVVTCPHHARGLSASLRCGIAALPPHTGGALICLGDMPGLTAEVIDGVIDTFVSRGGRDIVHIRRPEGGPGHPVAWPRDLFPELAALSGDQGGRDLITAHAARVTMVEGVAPSALTDIDTARDLDDWRSNGRRD